MVERGVDDALNERRKCCRLMQWQEHQCGKLIALTGTKFSMQKCSACKEKFCFFCNADWTPDRENKEFTCTKNCIYETMLTVTMIPWEFGSPGKFIPSFRYCPNCVSLIKYAKKCKNHQCPECQLWFCFFCLESSSEAGHNYNRECPVKTLTLPELYNASVKYQSSLNK